MSKTLKSIREAVATVKDNGQKDPIDVVHLEVPLLIRLFEYAREDATKDEDLHVVTENLVKLSKSGPLSMSSYDKVIPAKEEETSAGAIALPDVALFKKQKNEGVITASNPEDFAKQFDKQYETSFSWWGDKEDWKKLMVAQKRNYKISVVSSNKEKENLEGQGFKLVASGSGGPGNEEYILAHPISKDDELL